MEWELGENALVCGKNDLFQNLVNANVRSKTLSIATILSYSNINRGKQKKGKTADENGTRLV